MEINNESTGAEIIDFEEVAFAANSSPKVDKEEKLNAALIHHLLSLAAQAERVETRRNEDSKIHKLHQ